MEALRRSNSRSLTKIFRMKKYTNISDIHNLRSLLEEVKELKKSPYQFKELGKNKSLVMLFFNASLRTRLSTEKAAKNLGMDVMILNVNDTWNLEFKDGTAMNVDKAEHIKEAAQVISQYADVIAVRAFPTLQDKVKDESEFVIRSLVKYASVPIVNMESATAHPLQALADAITLEEQKAISRPKVVLSWAPHPRALPHAVANSFVRIMKELDVDVFRLEAEDKKDARGKFSKDWTARIMGIATVGGFLGYIFLVTLQPPEQNSEALINLVLGYLGGLASAIISFYFGASHTNDKGE